MSENWWIFRLRKEAGMHAYAFVQNFAVAVQCDQIQQDGRILYTTLANENVDFLLYIYVHAVIYSMYNEYSGLCPSRFRKKDDNPTLLFL